jgi:hypothetical protein
MQAFDRIAAGVRREALTEDVPLAVAFVVAALTALAMVASFDSFGSLAWTYGAFAVIAAAAITACLGARGWRPLFLGSVSGVASYLLVLPAVVVILVVVYVGAAIWGIGGAIFG